MEDIHNSRQLDFFKGAAILAAASIFVKIVGAIYKIPIFNILDDAGTGYFQATFSVYSLILTIATFGIPLAISRLVSSASAKGKGLLVKRYFNVSLPAFSFIGIIAMLLMFFFADNFAAFIRNTPAANGIRVLAPAVFFVCIIAVYRGYTQGFQDMVPTAVSQIIEVISKTIFGISIALWLTRLGYGPDIVSAGALVGITIGLGLCIPVLMLYKRTFDKKLPEVYDTSELPNHATVLAKIMKVSIPITIGASFMSIMAFIDTIIVMGRLQDALGYTEYEASALFGIFARGLTIYNLPSALIVPVAVSVMPAIAASIAKNNNYEAGNIMQSAIKLVVILALPAAAGIMVLANPIMISLYKDPRELTATVLMILGAASFFVCFQLVTTAILQANGFERIAMMTFPLGAVAKITISYILVGNQNFEIVGTAIGTLACFMVISFTNLVFMFVKIKHRPKLSRIFIKPVLCTAIMAVCAFFSYRLFLLLDSFIFGRNNYITYGLIAGDISSSDRLAMTAYLALAIIFSIIIYIVFIILTRTITTDDMKLIPKTDRVAKILKIRQ